MVKWRIEEGIILLWKRFLRVAFNRSYCCGIPTKYPALNRADSRLLQGWGSTVRHARPACTDRELKGRVPRQLLYPMRTELFFHSCTSSHRTCKKIMLSWVNESTAVSVKSRKLPQIAVGSRKTVFIVEKTGNKRKTRKFVTKSRNFMLITDIRFTCMAS